MLLQMVGYQRLYRVPDARPSYCEYLTLSTSHHVAGSIKHRGYAFFPVHVHQRASNGTMKHFQLAGKTQTGRTLFHCREENEAAKARDS